MSKLRGNDDMTHDQLCPDAHKPTFMGGEVTTDDCLCELIAEVRGDAETGARRDTRAGIILELKQLLVDGLDPAYFDGVEDSILVVRGGGTL